MRNPEICRGDARWVDHVGRTGVVLACVLALVGCAPTEPSGSEQPDGGSATARVVKGLPEGWQGPDPDFDNGHPVVGWLSEDEFGVVTMSSSGCPPVAQDLQVVAAREMRIEFDRSPHVHCNSDLASITHVFALPASMTGRPLTVTVRLEEFDTEYALELPDPDG
jgi:hypothetical protein